MPHVIIVFPCYNEAKRLEVAQFVNLQLPHHRLEFLFVNDGSQDDTFKLLKTLRSLAPEQIDLLDLQPNQGKAEAVRQGFLWSMKKSPDYIGFWDADLATPLDEIPRFCEILDLQPDLDMVFGARVKLLGRAIERKAYRHYFGRVFATAVSLVLNLPIYDSQCGAKLFRQNEPLRQAFATPFLSRWVFDVEIIARLKKIQDGQGIEIGSKIYELPLRQWQDVRGSKLHLKDGLLAYLDLWKIYKAYLSK
ncbi:MAG: glycosyltransferase [Chloroflexi bacterium]|nr:glycosyltransferase [Chloroflexota bacterium]